MQLSGPWRGSEDWRTWLPQDAPKVFAAVMRWHHSALGRDDVTAALLNVVRFPLLSVASLRALQTNKALTGLLGVVVSRLAAAALASHCGPSMGSICEPPPVRRRKAFPFCWADFGCSIRSGSWSVGKRNPRRVRAHDGSLYVLYADSRIAKWPWHGSRSGKVKVDRGRELSSVGFLLSLTDFDLNVAGDLYVLDASGCRVIKVNDGVSEVVGEGRLNPHEATLLAVGEGEAIYLVEADRRVTRFVGGETSVVAGGAEKGSTPAQLAGVGGLALARDGTLYISDWGNNRVQKWSPGDVVGTTVAGGNGPGNRDD